MKKYRQLIMGIIIGVLTMITVGVMANAAGSVKVSAWLVDNVKFTFDGEFRELPEEYGVLIYEDRTYVPARFVANNLGASVAWDETSRTVIIRSKPCTVCNNNEIIEEEIIEEQQQEETSSEQYEQVIEEEQLQPRGDYRKLPITKYYDDLEITVTLVNLTNEFGVEQDPTHTRVHLRVENKKNTPVQIQQTKTKAIVDGKEFLTAKAPSYYLDSEWYKDLRKDEIVEGYIVLPLIPEDSREMKLTLYLLENDWRQIEREIEFDIALELN